MPMCPEDIDSKSQQLSLPFNLRKIRVRKNLHELLSDGPNLMEDDDNQGPQYASGAGAFDKIQSDNSISDNETFPVRIYYHSDEDEPYVQCFSCDVQITFNELEKVDSNLVCPVCDEILGDENMIKLLITNQSVSTENSDLWVENIDKFLEELAIEGPTNNAFDNSHAKSTNALEEGDEKDTEDFEEKQLKASFVQKLVLSTMF